MKPSNESRHEKVLDDIVNDFRTNKNEKLLEQQKCEIRTSKCYRRRMWFRRISRVLLFASVVYAIATIAIEVRLLQSRPYFAYGGSHGNEFRINQCLYKMWYLRKTIDTFHAAYRRYPENLEELVKSGLLSTAPVCPTSKAKYILFEKNKKTVFGCGDPSAHYVQQIWAYMEGGPPVVEHDGVS